MSLSLHAYEKEMKSLFGPQILALNDRDPRPKLLYLQSSEDQIKNFKPSIPFKEMFASLGPSSDIEEHKCFEILFGTDLGTAPLIRKLNETHDIKYKIVNNMHQVCAEIQKASKLGKLNSVILGAHGNPNGMHYSTPLELRGTKLYSGKKQITSDCFSGLEPEAEIILKSCSTGTQDGIASVISKLSQRSVWAPESLSRFTTFTGGSPPRPTFLLTGVTPNLKLDGTCKFSNGIRTCGYWGTKTFSDMKEHVQQVASMVTTKEFLTHKCYRYAYDLLFPRL